MARVLKILSFAVILFLFWLVITGFLKSCKNNKNLATVEKEQSSDIFEEDDIFESADTENELSDDQDDEITNNEAPINYNDIDAAIEERKSDKSQNSKSSDTPTSENSSYSNGNYMVIAGNYIINSNAENMVLKLKKMGYQTAEIVIFDFSQYHSVVAKRFESYDDAYRLSRELVGKGIESYVHEKK